MEMHVHITLISNSNFLIFIFWAKQQEFIAFQFQSLEVQDQVVAKVGSFWGLQSQNCPRLPS